MTNSDAAVLIFLAVFNAGMAAHCAADLGMYGLSGCFAVNAVVLGTLMIIKGE